MIYRDVGTVNLLPSVFCRETQLLGREERLLALFDRGCERYDEGSRPAGERHSEYD